ncbi:heptaprenyl diphosphate synthase component 1 [Bacillus manliponensis]|uniref:heptaprenyl diphosphate synthase component 1 n=1 Tax=Bacillus manliponensis TaxID=574376 RepID=UPI003517C65E
MCDIYGSFTDIKQQLYKQLRHPYFIKYIEEPYVDEEKLALLYSLLKNANVHSEQVKHYVVTIMLVQIALDTHERVSVKKDIETDGFHKRRQLTVLAGDYYSGLYYYLLSMNHDILLIRALAVGIKEINEQKIKLYQQTYETIDDIVCSIKTIESALIEKVCDHFHLESFKPFVRDVLAINRMKKEYVCYQQSNETPIFEAWKKICSKEDELESVYKEWLVKAEAQIESNVQTHLETKELISILQETTRSD